MKNDDAHLDLELQNLLKGRDPELEGDAFVASLMKRLDAAPAAAPQPFRKRSAILGIAAIASIGVAIPYLFEAGEFLTSSISGSYLGLGVGLSLAAAAAGLFVISILPAVEAVGEALALRTNETDSH